jgi:hypothetical protein
LIDNIQANLAYWQELAAKADEANEKKKVGLFRKKKNKTNLCQQFRTIL